MVEHQADMEVVGEVLDPIELLEVVKVLSVDVVIITPLKVNGEPRICYQLLQEHPMLKIVILSAEGEAAFLYQSAAAKIRIDEPSHLAIFGAIRKSIR
ncbi:hypothetical protein EH223_18385 [candidate division KSB1 bacterium]|nr:hypothetical protein [candidate division KSB1 bacterium]RQW00713.1 MAG: hypothetical protein EH223_18385 [candidate division KSB1 bacterium]